MVTKSKLSWNPKCSQNPAIWTSTRYLYVQCLNIRFNNSPQFTFISPKVSLSFRVSDQNFEHISEHSPSTHLHYFSLLIVLTVLSSSSFCSLNFSYSPSNTSKLAFSPHDDETHGKIWIRLYFIAPWRTVKRYLIKCHTSKYICVEIMKLSSTQLSYVTMYHASTPIYLLLLHISATEAIFRKLVQSLLLVTSMRIGQSLHVNSC